LSLFSINTSSIQGNTIPQPDRGDVRIVVISDLNSSYGSTDYEPEVTYTIDAITKHWNPDIVLCAGDMVAGQDPDLPDKTVHTMWEAFNSVVLDPLKKAGIPFAFTLGNHDASAHPGHKRDRSFADRFWNTPGRWTGISVTDENNFPFYYSFKQNSIYYISLFASSAGVVHDSVQMDWLKKELKRDSAQQADLRIVFGHLPLYAVAEGRNREGEVLDKPDSLLQLFASHAVDIYVGGHHHAYYIGERKGIHLLYAGVLGQGPRPLIDTDRTPHQSVVIIDIDENDSIRYTAYRVDTSADPVYQLIDPETLPEIIHGINGYVRKLQY